MHLTIDDQPHDAEIKQWGRKSVYVILAPNGKLMSDWAEVPRFDKKYETTMSNRRVIYFRSSAHAKDMAREIEHTTVVQGSLLNGVITLPELDT